VQTDKRGYIPVDDQMRTNVKNVFAIGDVVGKVLLAHVATHQGLVTAGVIAGHDERMDYKAVPAATFTHPEVASVGLTEQKARETGHDVVVGKFPFAALGRAQTYGNTDGLVKIVADKKYGEILGVHIVGPSASDLIPEGVLALQLEATLEDIANTIHAHPTLGEGSMESSMVALGMPVHVGPPRRAQAAAPQPALAR
jgi:dihydrolipoamide dehydrogenase